eukprot:2949030-Pyramimonas_sp.AAC.1
MCTSLSDAQAVVRAARLQGFPLSVAKQAAYLGVDFSCGRRGRQTRRQRDDKHAKMSGEVK